MKHVYKIFTAFAMVLLVVACDHDESYTFGEQDPAGCQAIYFSTSKYTNDIEVEPGTTSFSVELSRLHTDKEGSVGIKVLNNENDLFTVPASVSFSAGQETASFVVTCPASTPFGVAYNLKMALEGDNVSLYANGFSEIDVSFIILKWEIGAGYILDGTMSTFFGVDAKLAYAIEIEKTEIANSTRYRFDSPFARVATSQDELGGYDGYLYNDPADLVPGEYKFVIDVTKDGASLAPVNMGMDWGYGMISCGSMYGYVSENISSYPLGKVEKDVITFPANSLYISMADYNGGNESVCSKPTTIYLTKEAYKATLN